MNQFSFRVFPREATLPRPTRLMWRAFRTRVNSALDLDEEMERTERRAL